EENKIELLKETGKSSSHGAAWEKQIADVEMSLGSSRLSSGRVSGNPSEDLLVLDAASRQIQVLSVTSSEVMHARAALGTMPGEVHAATLSVDSEPSAVLPMRLNGDALSDLVILRAGGAAPLVTITEAVATFVVMTTADGTGINSLRDAINSANSNPGADSITFAIPGGGIPTIKPTTSLPTITQAVTIDGTTQPAGLVEIDGSLAPSDGIRVNGGSSTIKGLVIN